MVIFSQKWRGMDRKLTFFSFLLLIQNNRRKNYFLFLFFSPLFFSSFLSHSLYPNKANNCTTMLGGLLQKSVLWGKFELPVNFKDNQPLHANGLTERMWAYLIINKLIDSHILLSEWRTS